MCGVIGLLIKDPTLEASLGDLVVPMIQSLSERGPDSSGVAVYSTPGSGVPGLGKIAGDTLRLCFGSDEPQDWAAISTAMGEVIGDAGSAIALPTGALVETARNAADAVAERCRSLPGVRVISRGRSLVLSKSTGHPGQAVHDLGLASWSGYLAVAHTRMATESNVTLLHSHPFVPAEDLCVVHNGSFSNHAAVRRRLERQGVTFESDNDSEVAARLLARRLEMGDDLEEATRWIMKELDGFFTLVVTTATGISVVRDAFACKPAVVAEAPGYVAVASEYRALAHLPDIDRAAIFEPRPEEVYTWNR